ncbi:MAG: PD-(D/E)XK nuclease family protein [Thermoproteus sp. AZ2]|uniref:PD-(D/E)XK nuclease family protein n=1 Tax=Thermoproteus sp. AZ2 TaxID=1609232 RepID=A0ACC6V323_9CREN
MGLKEQILELLKTDEEFRYAVAGLLGISAIYDSINKLAKVVEDLVAVVKSHDERLAKVEERLNRLEERQERVEDRLTRVEDELTKVRDRITAVEERLARLEAEVSSLGRRLIALGARWGVESEEAFRNAMRGVVEEILGAARVGRWTYFDAEGFVFGYPAQVEVDVAIADSTHILVEVKASASSGDVLKLARIGALYERVVGVRPKLILVAPFVDEEGQRAAERLGVEVYTKT